MLTRRLAKTSRASEPTKLASIGAYILILMIAFATNFHIRIVGSLPVAELLVIPLTPILIVLYSRSIFTRGTTVIFVMMGLWLFGQVLTDVYRGTEAVDWMRGDATIIFFALDLACLTALLKKNDRRKIVFLTGLAIGSMLSVFLQPPEERDIWKFGYSYGTMILVILISCYFFRHQKYSITGLLFVGLVGANLVFNYRSPILFLLVLAVLVLPIVPERIGPMKVLPRGSFARVSVLATLALTAGWASISLVHWATSIGLAGEEAQAKNLEQLQSKEGILLGGRPEIFVSSRAVLDSPILGHGSWAKDMKYVEMLDDIQIENGIHSDLEYVESINEDLIPSHSHIMGAWVNAGILGALFWGYIFWIVLKSIVVVSDLRPPLAPIYAWLLVWYLWAILFSPFGGTDRLGEAATIVIMADLLGFGTSRVKKAQWLRQVMWRRIPLNARLSSTGRGLRASNCGPERLNPRKA